MCKKNSILYSRSGGWLLLIYAFGVWECQKVCEKVGQRVSFFHSCVKHDYNRRTEILQSCYEPLPGGSRDETLAAETKTTHTSQSSRPLHGA